MTQSQYTIPAEGLTHTAGTRTWTLKAVGCGGYSLDARDNGRKVGGDYFTFSTNALSAWNAIVAENPIAAPLQPAAANATVMTGAEVQVVGEAIESTGTITRGRGYARADIKSLQAMARRGFVRLVCPEGQPYRPTGAVVTDLGRRTWAAVVAKQAEKVAFDGPLAKVLAFA